VRHHAHGGSPFFLFPKIFIQTLIPEDIEMSQMQAYLLGTEGDMVERGLIMVAIVVAAVGLWFSLGAKLAAKLGEVANSF
jgi:hypothetical protein